eukprot:1675031-Pyramimonas_sp.AAC.1
MEVPLTHERLHQPISSRRGPSGRRCLRTAPELLLLLLEADRLDLSTQLLLLGPPLRVSVHEQRAAQAAAHLLFVL